jgi:hypothetical protein
MSEAAVIDRDARAATFETYIYRKVGLRIIPILFLGYFVATWTE